MDQTPELLSSPESPQPAAEAAPPAGRTRQRLLVIPIAALVFATAAGVGYAAGTRNVADVATVSSPTQSATIEGDGFDTDTPDELDEQPGTRPGRQRGGQLDGQADGQAGGQPGALGDSFGQLPAAPEGAGGSGSTDTTGTASGDQLTGLVRIVITNDYADGEAVGTGMVLTADGSIATNHHVVEGATDIVVTIMSTGDDYPADVVGTDAETDVAVLQLQDASGLDAITPDEDAVSAGDAVTAVGDGDGAVDFLSSATGEVLATDQSITTQNEQSAETDQLSGLIEISSDVVSGYSGGATYDDEGEVLGMTTAASSGTRDIIGYAIPMATVLQIADDLGSGVQDTAYAYGYPAFIGIGLDENNEVLEVYADTPAEDAGLAAGDLITQVDGETVRNPTQLQAAIAAHDPGESTEITWSDAQGVSETADVTLIGGPVS